MPTQITPSLLVCGKMETLHFSPTSLVVNYLFRSMYFIFVLARPQRICYHTPYLALRQD